MNTKIIGIGILGLVVISVITVLVFVRPIDMTPPRKESDFKDWNKSGPFAINKKQYKIGENIFLIAEGLAPIDKGEIVFIFPNATRVYFSLPFDSEQKSSFNYYFRPMLSKAKHICDTGELIGDWTIVFKGTNYEPLRFKIINETDPTQIGSFQKIC